MTTLLDSNVLMALGTRSHVHNPAAERWLSRHRDAIATCPITQGALVRAIMREGKPAGVAMAVLESIVRHERHEFWPDDIDYLAVGMGNVLGHRQVTDAYLAELARRKGGRIATLDRGFVAVHADVAELVPTS